MDLEAMKTIMRRAFEGIILRCDHPEQYDKDWHRIIRGIASDALTNLSVAEKNTVTTGVDRPVAHAAKQSEPSSDPTDYPGKAREAPRATDKADGQTRIADTGNETMTHTKDILAAALTKAGLTAMAAKAAEGYYHDFLSPLATPEMQLAEDLFKIGTPAALELRRRVIDGDFDASKAESDEWANSPEGQDAFARLMRGKR